MAFLLIFALAAFGKDTVSIMTFNVENLFDTKHDEGKDDQTYRPIKEKQTKEHLLACGAIRQKMYQKDCVDADWNEDTLKKKLTNLSKTILQVNNGKGPDIIGLQEVENIEILERLRKEYLRDAGYLPSILIEGNDIRGIDVALMSKLPLEGKPQLHDIVFRKNRKKGTERGILEATFKLPDSTPITVFVVHLLAPSNPVARREFAIDKLNEIKKNLPKDRLSVATGDFNITAREDRKLRLVENKLEPFWSVSHRIGCESCSGTHYTSSKKEWSFFDMILLSKNFTDKSKSGWKYVKNSVRTVTGFEEQIAKDGSPQEFNMMTGKGVSDHIPLLLEISEETEDRHAKGAKRPYGI